ncbi:band 7 protein AGAP004871-like [Mercenaria mercenaria]|uniref:band 7 protein AGAP004871-like n=1 Tax=Mercenaria mercenaria TaxID=6596 RepID=UPI001E1D443C|nr:band 7 protein AGAP004871-like [Mercenaria mercenaria]
MSKVNSVRPSLELDGDTFPLRPVGDGATTSGSHMNGHEHVIGGIPSNWDDASSPMPKPDTEGRDDKHKHRDNKVTTDWDEESDPGHNYCSRQIPDTELEITDKHKDIVGISEWAVESDPEQPVVRDELGKYREYTPELPVAEKLEESHYKIPNTSKADVANITLPTFSNPLNDRPDDAPKKRRKARSSHTNDSESSISMDGMYTFNQKEETYVTSENSNSIRKENFDSRKHLVQLHATNRVSPADNNTIRRPKTHGQTISKEELKRRKDFVIGADENTDGAGCCGWLLYTFSILLIVVSLPFSLIFCIKVVQEYERAVIFRLGRLPSGGAKGPGIFFIIPCIESYTKIDLRTVSFDVPPQEVLTKDSVTVSVDAVVYYRVSNPTVSVANVENAHHSTRLLAQTTLRNILGTKNMSEILSDRESISQGMQSTLDEATDNWGIKVERVEIKDVRLPVQLQRAMAAEAEAAREARAKVIAAEGEQKASRALKEAADVMAKSSAALQLRYLQTLSSISAEKNSTIIFPLPIDLIKAFIDKKS